MNEVNKKIRVANKWAKLQRVALQLTALLMVSGSALAMDVISQPDGSWLYNLREGEAISGSRIGNRDTVSCAQSYNPPAPPPPPACPTADFDSADSSLRNNIRRLSNGKCGSWYVRNCGDWLEDHALNDTQEQLANAIRGLKNRAESVCQMSMVSCQRSETARVIRDYQSTIQLLSQSVIKVRVGANNFRELPMLDRTINVNLNCPRGPR